MNALPEVKTKVVFLGGSGVGKSSIISMLFTGRFSDTIPNTIGSSFFTKTYDHGEKFPPFVHKMNVWDTSGQEVYFCITKMYFRDAHAIILVVDAEDESSLDAAERFALEVKDNISEKEYIVLVVNKIDTLPAFIPGIAPDEFVFKSCSFYDRVKQFEETHKIAKSFWISAKNHEMVEALFASVDEEVGKGTIGPGLGKPGGANAKGNAFLSAVSTPSAARRLGCCGY